MLYCLRQVLNCFFGIKLMWLVRLLWTILLTLKYVCTLQLFEKVEVDKPSASHSTSAEIYIICPKYKAPAKIDPCLFYVRHLFQGGKEPPKVISTNAYQS